MPSLTKTSWGLLVLLSIGWPDSGDTAPWPAGPALSDETYFQQSWGRKLSPTESEHEASRWLREAKDDRSRKTAYLMRGLARYRRGKYRLAVADLATAETGVVNRDLAVFFRAESLFHLGRYEAAGAVYKRFGRRFPTSTWRFRARLRAGDCLMFQGKYQAGVRILEEALKAYPDYPHPVALRVAIAEGYQTLGRLDQAAAWLDKAIWKYPEDPQIHRVRRMLQSVLALGGTLPAHSPEHLYARGVDLRKRKYFGPATEALQSVVGHADTAPKLRWRARYQIARTLFQMERYPEAVTSFRALVSDAHTVRSARLARRWESYSLEHLGRPEQAALALIAGRGRADRPSTETLYKVAWLYFDAARYEKAAEYFGLVTKRGGTWARKTRFMRAWLSYRLGDYRTAAEAFKRLKMASRYRTDRHGYWLARSLAHLGDWNAAADTYRGIIESKPNGYYAYQSRARLKELNQPAVEEPSGAPGPDESYGTEPPPESGVACEADDERPGCRLMYPITADTGGEQEAGDTVPSDTDTVSIRDPVSTLRTLSDGWGGAFPAIGQAHELAVIGELRWAGRRLRLVSDELRDFRRAPGRVRRRWAYRPLPYVDYRKGPRRAEWGRLNTSDIVPRSDRKRIRLLGTSKGSAFWKLLRDSYAGLGDHHYARRHSGKADRPRGRPEDHGNQLWKQRFARAYEPIVVSQAAHYGLDPSFIWALMTVESTYNPWAISRAGARGLMQVMPHTGGLVADRMNWRNFGPALLYEPEVAIEMSAWYFHQLLEKFNGQLPLAIAGYNAGPHRVALWLRRKGHLAMDEFIEEIPYTEARGYTKKVLKYLALYRRIYLGNAGVWVGQVIDPAFRDNINF